jgi:uncharacterized protein involved in exopolysaccharide biosynthesis
MPGMQQRPAQQLDFYKYLRILWRRKWLLAVPLTLCTVIGVTFALYHPTEYESKGILEAAVINPLTTAGGKHRRVNVRAEVHDIRNRMLGYTEVREILVGRKVDFGEDVDPEDSRQIERLYRKVTRYTRVHPLSGSHLAVSFRSTSAERNAALVNEMIKKFVGEDKREALRQAKLDLEYYRDRHEKARARMTEIDNQLREFSKAHPGFRDEIAEIYNDHKDALAEENDLRRQIQELDTALAGLRKDLANEPATVTETHAGEVPAEIRAARTRVEACQEIFRRNEERYTPAHRRWQAAKQDLDRALAHLKGVDKGKPDDIVEEKPNPRLDKLKNDIAETDEKLKQLNMRLLAKNKLVSEKYDLLRRGPELLTEKRRLEEERDSASYLLRDHSKGLREAEKELQRLSTEAYSSNYKVREYARVSHTPVRETKLKIIGVGAFVGLLIGAGLIVLMEYLDQTFKTVDDVRETLGLPALGVIPAIYTPRDHRRRLWFRVLTVSSAVFVIGVAVAIYFSVGEVQIFLHEQWGNIQSMISSW